MLGDVGKWTQKNKKKKSKKKKKPPIKKQKKKKHGGGGERKERGKGKGGCEESDHRMNTIIGSRGLKEGLEGWRRGKGVEF